MGLDMGLQGLDMGLDGGSEGSGRVGLQAVFFKKNRPLQHPIPMVNAYPLP